MKYNKMQGIVLGDVTYFLYNKEQMINGLKQL